jgi:dUTP pyrophosphatase
MTMEYIMERLNIFRTHPSVTLPKFATKQSVCFDLAYQPWGHREISGFDMTNGPIKRIIGSDGKLAIMPGDRILVPTGLIFDIPEGYSVRVHARSGLSFKQGLVLANQEGVIDSDYYHETYILLTNISQTHAHLMPGDRIAQAEMTKNAEYVLWETETLPQQKTDRVGGLGSTGINNKKKKDTTEDARSAQG